MSAALLVLVKPPFLVFYVWFACVLYVHYRGRVRLRFERQLTEHSGLFAPLNTLMYLFSALPKDPILSARRFPQFQILRDNWQVIRDEALALAAEGHIDYNASQQDLAFVSFKKLGWKRFHMKWYHDFLPSALERCPRTVDLLRQVPRLNAAAFTMLPPGAKLGKHRDPFASSMRYHLGLLTPSVPGCQIWVDGQAYTWRDGEDLVFDETYVHWAENATDQNRIILFADFTRPLRFAPVRALNDFLIRHVYRITRSKNEAQEKAGVLNRITPAFFYIKHFFRGIKTRCNRRLYYSVKYSLVGLLLWFVVRTQF